MRSGSAAFSIVVPAHQEEAVIGRCLDAFWPNLAGTAEVVVVANGCRDRTAEVARTYAGVRVVELAEGSKPAALDAGDDAVTAFPRIYLDADVVISEEALRAVAGSLPAEAPRVAAPHVRFVTTGRPWLVRAFYAAYARTPYTSHGLVGLGVYGLNAAGRRRFDRFPVVTSDDLFVQRAFAPHERVVGERHHFDVQTPRDVRSLVAVRTRTAQGNKELASDGQQEHAASTGATVRSLLADALRDLRTLPSTTVYVAVVCLARSRARRSTERWHRDESTR